MDEVLRRDDEEQSNINLNTASDEIARASKPMTIIKDIAIMAVPKAIGDAIQTADALATAFMLARLNNTNILKSSAIIYSTQNFLIGTGNAALNATCILISQKLTDRTQHEKIGEIYRSSLIYASVIGLIPIAITLSSKYLFLLCGQEEDVATLASEFFHRSFIGLLANYYLICAQQLLLGIDKAKFLPVLQLSTRGLNTFLSYLSIFHGNKFNLEPLQGLGYAFSISMITNVVIYNIIFKISSINETYGLYTNLSHSMSTIGRENIIHHLKTLAKLGVYIAVQTCVELAYFEASNLAIGYINPISLASVFIAGQFTSLPGILLSSLALTASVKVSYALGDENLTTLNSLIKQRMRRYGNYTIFSAISVTSLFIIIFALFSRQLISLFLSDDELIKDTQKYLIVGGIGQIFKALRETSTGALFGIKDTKTSMIVDIALMLLIGVPLGLVITLTRKGAIGIYISAVITVAIQSIILFLIWLGKTTTYAFTNSIAQQLSKFSDCSSNCHDSRAQLSTYEDIDENSSHHQDGEKSTPNKKWYCFWQSNSTANEVIIESKEITIANSHIK